MFVANTACICSYAIQLHNLSVVVVRMYMQLCKAQALNQNNNVCKKVYLFIVISIYMEMINKDGEMHLLL